MHEPQMTTLAGEPLAVEFLFNGEWCPAVLLGWRQELDGTCRARIQFVIGGLRRASWMALADLRLPEPEHSWSTPEPRRPVEPRTRPDMLLPDRDWSRPLPPLPEPRSSASDRYSWA